MNHIITSYSPLSGPNAERFFWSAISNNYNGPEDVIGYGRTSFNAQADFLDQAYDGRETTVELVDRVIERRGRVPFTFDGYCEIVR